MPRLWGAEGDAPHDDQRKRRIAFERRMEAADAAQLAHNERFRELYTQFKPSLGLEEIDRVRRLARRLKTSRTLAALLERYRQLDDRMERVERALSEFAIGWDKHVQEEVDRSRGK